MSKAETWGVAALAFVGFILYVWPKIAAGTKG